MPSTVTEALGAQLTEQHLTVESYDGGAAAGGGPSSSVHGHGDTKGEVHADRDRFFRFIDRGILEHHSRPSGLPLMLAALPEYHEPFRAVSHNPFLMADGVARNPESLTLDQLRAEAWRVVEPDYLGRLAKLSDDFQAARARDLGTDDLARLAVAATAGRVGTLLVEADRQIPGTITPATGEIQPGDLSDPEVGDVLDDLAELVLRAKGTVVVVPSDRMPSGTGVAAIYRF